MRKALLIILAVPLLVAGGWYLSKGRSFALPYFDRFRERDISGWLVMGGNWQFSGDAVVNRSDEHGAKLVTGSSEWGNISLDADLKLIGHSGDLGVMVRVSDAEPGVDAYNGYYVGLRSNDRSLVMGRADYGWTEGPPTAIDGGIEAARWYHLHVVAVGCTIGASALDTTTGKIAYAMMQEPNCIPKGMIGIRSMATGGAWKNIVVEKAGAADLEPIRNKVTAIETPHLFFRESDVNRTSVDSATGKPEADITNDDSSPIITTIEAIKIHSIDSQNRVVIRGVVTLLAPLYVQDSTGGLAVEASNETVLNLGDEVEIAGSIKDQNDNAILVAQTVKLTGDRSLAPPSSVTSTQAAGILFDGRLAELRARLLSKSIDSTGNRVILRLEDSAQIFRAEGPLGLSGEQLDKLVPGSELRIRGVCRVGPWQGKDGGAFTILMRSIEDVDVISGPPWWSTRLLVREIGLVAVLIGIGIYIYLKIERSKMRAILDERARLAHEMHDTLAQSFAGVGFHLQGVRNSVRSGTLTTPDVVDKLTFACELITRTHRDASAEIAALHPGLDDGSDLLTLLERCAYTMLEGKHIPIKLIREGSSRDLSLAIRDALFHIGREAITNVLRHAAAESITMRMCNEFRAVTLEIIDDGRGFNYEKHCADFGLCGMRSRSAAIGAELDVISDIGYGTTIRIRAPYRIRKKLLPMRRNPASANVKK